MLNFENTTNPRYKKTIDSLTVDRVFIPNYVKIQHYVHTYNIKLSLNNDYTY